MPRSKELRFGELFGELHYKFGRNLDGISRSPGALTAEHTYRAVVGYPEVYITCIYRWTELAVAGYISSQAIQLGKRLGKNVLIVPIEGNEEEFWVDAKELVRRITVRNGNTVELDDSAVHLLISGYSPQSLLEENLPFLLLDVGELTSVEFVGFFSKLLDLFDVNLESNFFARNVELGPTAGRALLASSLYQESSSRDLKEALKVLSEIVFVLDKIGIDFYGFQWPIQEAFKTSLEGIYADSELHAKLMRVKDRFKNLKDGSDYGGKKRSIANDKATYQTFIEDIVMGDKFENIHNATIINRSLVEKSFNKVKTDFDEETANALKRVADEIERSGNREAADNFHFFNEELQKPEPKKSVLRTLWGGITVAVPSILQITDVVTKISKLLGY